MLLFDWTWLNAVIEWLSAGFWDLSWWQVVLYTLLTTHITIASVTIYLHRHQAHRALDLHPLAAHLFRFWLWIGTGMGTRPWVSIHRKHHAKCETVDDPHSPQTRGIKKVFWQGAELYRDEAKNQVTLTRYGEGCPDDWLERNLYSRFSWQGVGLMLILDLVLFGAIGATVWAVQMLWIPVMAAGVINGIGHYWGYRNAETPDASTNIVSWGIVIGGEELHNNHHTYPTSAKFSVKPHEFDIGWGYIRLLERCGLARVKSVPPERALVRSKLKCDTKTFEALVACRYEVLQQFRYATKGQYIDSAQSKRLTAFEIRLQQLWTRTDLSAQQLIAELQRWCDEAQESAIPWLQAFAFLLPGYSLKPRKK